MTTSDLMGLMSWVDGTVWLEALTSCCIQSEWAKRPRHHTDVGRVSSSKIGFTKLHPNLVQYGRLMATTTMGPCRPFRMKQRESLPSSTFSRKTLQVEILGFLKSWSLGKLFSGKIKAVSVCPGDSVSHFKSKMYSIKYNRENSTLYTELNRRF